MKILIICSAKTTMRWEKQYHSAGFDKALRQERSCGIEKIQCKQGKTGERPVYVSAQKSAQQTAEKLFSEAEIIQEALLDEIPMRSYKDTPKGKELPLRRWRFMAKRQWRRGDERQPESRQQSIERAEKLIALLEERGQDCILVSHPNFIKILRKRFRRHGCLVTGSGNFVIAPLDRILVTRPEMHCGGCGHNCLLSDPGCLIGQDAAKRRKKK